MKERESKKTAVQASGMSESEKDAKKQYHPPACASLELELRDVKEDLTFQPEYLLNTKPNQIDLLITCRREKVHSVSGLAAIFRKYNIVEYKSPNDTLGIAIFHRTIAYAYLLASKDSQMRPVRDITLTFIRRRRPVKLLKELMESGYTVSNYESGIYHIRKENCMDMQIIVTSRLGQSYHWITMLTDQVELEDIERIKDDITQFTDERDLLNVEAVFNLIVQLNQDKKWVKGMTGMGALRDLFQEEFDQRDRKIEAQKEEILDLSEQLQTKEEQLQTKEEQLQTKEEQLQTQSEQFQVQNEQLKSKEQQLKSEQEKNTRLQQEIEELKHQLQELVGKIAVL